MTYSTVEYVLTARLAARCDESTGNCGVLKVHCTLVFTIGKSLNEQKIMLVFRRI